MGRALLIVGGLASLTAGAWWLLRTLLPVESDDGERDDTSAAGELVDAWEHGREVGQIAVVELDGVLMETGLASAWSSMRDAADADGVTLKPTSGFRTMEQQQQLYAEHVAGTRTTAVARPGYSSHQNGRALDIGVRSSDSSDEYLWLDAHAARYGFRNTGAHFSPPEWWHWEFFGEGGFV